MADDVIRDEGGPLDGPRLSMHMYMAIDDPKPVLAHWNYLAIMALCVFCGAAFDDWWHGVWLGVGVLAGSGITAWIVLRWNWEMRRRHPPEIEATLQKVSPADLSPSAETKH